MRGIERLVLAGLLVLTLKLHSLFVTAASFTCQTPLDIRDSHGAQTEKLPGSRIEYNPFPGGFIIAPGQNIYIEFKTWHPQGLIFLSGNFEYNDMVGAYLQRGHLTFARRCANGRAFEIHRNKLNDGRWHTLKYVHSYTGGLLQLDGRFPFRRYHMGPCKNFSSVLFGGLPPEVVMGRISGNEQNHRFAGCLRNMRINGMVPTTHPGYIAVSQCGRH